MLCVQSLRSLGEPTLQNVTQALQSDGRAPAHTHCFTHIRREANAMKSLQNAQDEAPGRHLEIAILGGFRFWIRGRDALPDLAHGSQRLLAFLALRDRSVTRSAASGTLWPEASEEHAHASLRSAISRLTQIAHEAIVVTVVAFAWQMTLASIFGGLGLLPIV